MTTESSPSPSVLKRIFLFFYHGIFFPPTTLARVLIWTPLLILALIAGSWAAWGLGYLKYQLDGEPNDWRTRQRQQSARLAVGRIDFQQARTASDNLFEITAEIPEEAFMELAVRTGNFVDHERMVEDYGALTGEEDNPLEILPYELPTSLFEKMNFPLTDTEPPLYLRFALHPFRIAQNGDGLVTRFQFPIVGFDVMTARSFLLRMRSRYGTAIATQGSMDDNNTMYEIMIWRSGESLILCEWNDVSIEGKKEPEYMLYLTQVTSLDPSYPVLLEQYINIPNPTSNTESEP